MIKRRLPRALIRATILSSLFFSLGAQAANDHSELKIALNAEFDTLNPIVNSMMAAIYVLDATSRPLVALDLRGKPYPVLIDKIPTLANKLARRTADGGLEATFQFRENAKWGDGKPVTCADLRASWEIGRADTVSCPFRSELTEIVSIENPPDKPKTCQVKFKEAKWNFYLSLPRPVPAHLEGPIFAAHKDKAQEYERNSLYAHDPTQAGLYNGPYRVSEVKVGNYIALTPNPNFAGPAPSFQKVIFKFILNSGAMESALLSGGVDMTSSSGFSFDQALAFEKKVKRDKLPYRVDFIEANVYSQIVFNLDHPILADVRVRKALALSFNRQELVQAFFENRQKPALHFASKTDSWYTEDPKKITLYPYDKNTANRLLDEAGWAKGPDGFRYRNGQKLTLTLSGVAEQKLNETIEVFLQNAWRQIGVQLQIKNYPARVFFGQVVRHREFEMSMSSLINTPDDIPRSLLSSDQIPSAANAWAGSNRSGWKNPQVDTLLAAAEHEFSLPKRVKLMQEVLRFYTAELPSFPTYSKSNSSVVPTGLTGYHLSPHLFSEFLEIENWRWPAAN